MIKKNTSKQLGKQFSRALFDVNSINKEARTIDVVFATETPVLKSTWDGMINEILVCDAANVRMERINSGAPLLDTHDKYSVTTQLGVVENARAENRQLKATVRFSKRDDVEKVWQDVQDGIIRNISVGYRVYEYDITERLDKSVPDYRATDWEPFEISLVPVPADFNSGTRSNENTYLNEVKITQKSNKMNKVAEILAAVRAAGLSVEFAETLLKDETITLERAQADIAAELAKNKPARAANPAAAAPVAPAADGNRTASEILFACRAANLGLEFAENLINTDGVTVETARTAIIAELAKNQSPAGTRSANAAAVKPGTDETDKKRTGMSNALLHRVSPNAVKAEDCGEFRGLRLIDMAKECLTNANISTRGMSYREIANLALNCGERQHTTSDFPLILGNTINRTLRAAYELQPRTFLPFCTRNNATDFRTMSRTQLSDFVSLDEVKEGAEYKMGTIGEGAETYKVGKYGKLINISWETLVNDDLNAFGRVPQAMAASAAQKQSDLVYAILTSNPNMGDGNALFDASNHGNLTGTGTAISVTSLGVARSLLRKQTAPKAGKLNLAPEFIIVGPDQETLALQYTSQNYVSAKSSDINVWAGLMKPIVEARLTGTAWYLAANPSMIDTIEYAFLDGEELFTEQRSGFEVDGMQVKVRMVFGAKAIDWRGLYKNAGA